MSSHKISTSNRMNNSCLVVVDACQYIVISIVVSERYSEVERQSVHSVQAPRWLQLDYPSVPTSKL